MHKSSLYKEFIIVKFAFSLFKIDLLKSLIVIKLQFAYL